MAGYTLKTVQNGICFFAKAEVEFRVGPMPLCTTFPGPYLEERSTFIVGLEHSPDWFQEAKTALQEVVACVKTQAEAPNGALVLLSLGGTITDTTLRAIRCAVINAAYQALYPEQPLGKENLSSGEQCLRPAWVFDKIAESKQFLLLK